MIQQVKDILDNSGYDFNYQIEESHVYSLMELAYHLGKSEKQSQSDPKLEQNDANIAQSESVEQAARKWIQETSYRHKGFIHCFICGANWQKQQTESSKVEVSAIDLVDELWNVADKWLENHPMVDDTYQNAIKSFIAGYQYATLKASALQSLLEDKEKEIESLTQQLEEYKSSLKALVEEIINQTKKY